MKIVGENLEKWFLAENRGCSATARHSESLLAVARFMLCIARRANVTGPDMNSGCSECELAVASLAVQNLHNFIKPLNHSFYVRMQLDFHEHV
jgi:hypothetical protein